MAEIYIDIRTGDQLIGEAAIEQRIIETGPGDILPLRELLLTKEFPFGTKSFEKADTHEWSRDDYINLGKWAVKLLQAGSNQPPRVTSEILERLYVLGIGPIYGDYKKIKAFTALSEFQEEIGSVLTYSPKGKFDNWSTKDFIAHARKVEKTVGRKPIEADYAAMALVDNNAPGLWVITRRVGASQLNEDLGYPNVRHWDKDDFIDFGVRVMQANSPDALNINTIRVISGRRRGPGYSRITARFSWDNYKAQVLEKFNEQEYEKQVKLDSYRTMIKEGALPGDYVDLPDSELLKRAACFILVTALIPQWSDERKKEVAALEGSKAFITTLVRAKRRLQAADVEIAADTLGLHDDIWPIDYFMDYLKVSPEEVEEVKQRRMHTKRIWEINKQQAS